MPFCTYESCRQPREKKKIHYSSSQHRLPARSFDIASFFNISSLLLVGLLLEVVEEDSEGAGLLAEVGDDGAGSADGLLDVALLVELGEAAPGAEVLAGVDHDDGDLTLGAEGADELLVLLVLAVLGEAAEAGGAAVEGLGALVQALLETVVDEGLLEDLLGKVDERIRKGAHGVRTC